MSNHHSRQAWDDNRDNHDSKTKRAFDALWNAKHRGLTATELSVLWGEPEHRSCGAALSRARKEYAGLVRYARQKGETHGRYYHRKYAPQGASE